MRSDRVRIPKNIMNWIRETETNIIKENFGIQPTDSEIVTFKLIKMLSTEKYKELDVKYDKKKKQFAWK